jgi:hypothetical protein
MQGLFLVPVLCISFPHEHALYITFPGMDMLFNQEYVGTMRRYTPASPGLVKAYGVLFAASLVCPGQGGVLESI